MDDWIAYLKSLPWKDWATPIIAGVLALTGVVYTAKEKAKMAQEDRRLLDDAKRRSDATAQTTDLTDRFKALMDGYEAHIEGMSQDLVAIKGDLKDMRAERDRLRKLYDDHMAVCTMPKGKDNA